MKKWISILCIVLLLCSAMSLAVSAAAGTPEDPVVCSGLNFNMVKIPAGATYHISFADTSGAAKRQISINSSTDKAAGYTLTIGETVQSSDENGYCNVVTAPDANGTYFFSITNNATKQATFFINFYDVSPYAISDTMLYEGENAVTTLMTDTTLYAFEPEEIAIYEIAINEADALLSYWNGSPFYVTGLAQEAVDGKLEVTCASIGQVLLIGLSGVNATNITITKIDDYIPPATVEYVTYQNTHIPQKDSFKLPESGLTEVDITVPQTVVLGSDGIYRYGSANGPIMYVDMTGVPFADLYECYYPASGGEVADRMRGTYLDEAGNTCGYDFLDAMHAYADALDSDGFYYLTVDVANYLNMYGKDQGWFQSEYSPFEEIQNGAFIAESAWLITSYYGEAIDPDEPSIPDAPVDPEDPDEPSIPDAPVDPEDPDEPSIPDAPVDPEDPDEPSIPDAPVDPEDPDKPSIPDAPVNPEDPDEPSIPDAPVDPEDPDEPSIPDAPVDPEDPSTPDAPADPDTPDSPATGDMSAFGVMAALLLSSAGALTFRKKRN